MNFIKKTIFPLLLTVVLSGNAQTIAYNIGDTVNNVSGVDLDGNTFDIYEQCEAGRYVFIKFYTTTCGYCQTLTPVFNEFYEKYGCNSAEIACVSVNGYANIDNTISFNNQYGGPHLHAPSITAEGGGMNFMNRFSPSSFPLVCVISPDKTLLTHNIFPFNSVEDGENIFPEDFNPQPVNCALNTANFTTVAFEIFPNPVVDYFSITCHQSSQSEKVSVKIFNHLGQKLNTINTVTDTKISVNLHQGVYLVEISNQNNKIYKKLVVNSQ